MLNLAQAVNTMFKYIKENETEEITLYTYKKDRFITVRKINEFSYEMLEHGFNDKTMLFDSFEALKKQLKKAVRLEFPRSHSAYLQKK